MSKRSPSIKSLRKGFAVKEIEEIDGDAVDYDGQLLEDEPDGISAVGPTLDEDRANQSSKRNAEIRSSSSSGEVEELHRCDQPSSKKGGLNFTFVYIFVGHKPSLKHNKKPKRAFDNFFKNLKLVPARVYQVFNNPTYHIL